VNKYIRNGAADTEGQVAVPHYRVTLAGTLPVTQAINLMPAPGPCVFQASKSSAGLWALRLGSTAVAVPAPGPEPPARGLGSRLLF